MSNVIPLSRFRADMQKSGSQRLREILSAKDVSEEVQKLDPLELFGLSVELGESGAMDLLALADAEQIKRVVDLGIGRDHSPDFRALDRLVEAAIAHGHGTATRLFEKLDEELQTLYLARRVLVHEARDSEDLPDAPEGVERLLTPDNTFIIEVQVPTQEQVDASLPAAANDPSPQSAGLGFSALPLIADLYYVDWQRADTIMRDVRHALASELEEASARVRDARLEELGFPPHEDAMRLFSRRGAQPLAKRSEHTAPRSSIPAAYAEPFFKDSFFIRVVSAITHAELLGEIESELIYLTNADAVVESRLFGDSEAVRAAAADVRDWLSLGLESASSGDPEKAQSLLAEHPLREIFSFGLEQCYKLGDWAKKANAQRLFSLPGLERRALSSEDEHFLKALLARIPRFVPSGLDAPRAFASRREIALAQKRLETISRSLLGLRAVAGSVDDFARALQGTDPDAASVSAEQLLRSALVRRFIGASLRDTFAVSGADLRAFRAAAGDDWPKERLGELPAEVASAVQSAWTALVAEIGRLGEEPDPRFVNLVTQARP